MNSPTGTGPGLSAAIPSQPACRQLHTVSRFSRVSKSNSRPRGPSNGSFSTLSLFVLRIFADDPDNTLALNDFALIANRLYGSSYFHNLLLSSFSAISRRTSGSSCTPTHYATMPEYDLLLTRKIRIRITNSQQPLNYITRLCR